MALEGRDPVPLRVHIAGDSLITESQPYESILRPGVIVEVRTASVVRGDELTGRLVATYRTEAGDERVGGTVRGHRVP